MKPPLYIHIPYCLKKCGYCDFFSKPQKEIPGRYVEALANQIKFFARAFCVEEWFSVYIGGGTPSLLPPSALQALCQAVKSAAPLARDCEWTIEANPETIGREFLEAARAGGINRLSLGIQCSNDSVLRAAGRAATEADIKSAVELAKNFWRGSWSADLIAGLPLQTKSDLERDINFLQNSGASHISLYSLTLEEGTPLKKAIDQGELCYDEEGAEELWLFGRDFLEARGFLQYEVSNFAKPGFESRHNAAYWSLKSYLGAGAGAAGTIYGAPQGVRWTNVLDARAYMDYWTAPQRLQAQSAASCHCLARQGNPANQDSLQAQNPAAPLTFPCQTEILDMDTQEFEYLMMNLRTRRGASAREYKERFGKDLAERLGFGKNSLQGQKVANQNSLQGQKLPAANWLQKIEREGQTFYAMTREGLLFLNSFLEEL